MATYDEVLAWIEKEREAIQAIPDSKNVRDSETELTELRSKQHDILAYNEKVAEVVDKVRNNFELTLDYPPFRHPLSEASIPLKPMMHIEFFSYFRKMYKFPPIFVLFTCFCLIYILFLLHPYFDHDEYMLLALHILDAPDPYG